MNKINEQSPKNGNHKNGNHKKVKKFEMKFKFDVKNLILYIMVGFLLLSFFLSFSVPINPPKEVSLSQVLTEVKEGKVKEITVEGDKLEIEYKDSTKATSYKERGESLVKTFEASGINPKDAGINIKDMSTSEAWVNILSTLLPTIFIAGLLLFMFRQARGAQDSVFSFGASKAKLFNKDTPKVTFSDVAGVDEAKKELEEVVDFLKNPKKYQALGARTPKGVLLIGPSGCGKTLLARAVAGQAGVPFFSMAGSEFMEMLVGVGASRARDLFATAKKHQPAIVFIDEIDAIGRQRGYGLMGGHDEREQTLNQILVEMDGFTPNEQLVVVAATNRPDVLDPALVRPGRFDRRVVVDMPDLEGRKAILKIHMKNKPFAGDVDWERVAKRTVGFSGADLENMLNEAAILAARLNKTLIDMSDLEEAATKVKMGPEKKRMQSDLDKKMTAYHEAGHAVVTFMNPRMDPVHRISIVSRGLALGYTLIPPEKDVLHETKTKMIEQISTMFGGRAAEEIVFGDVTSGASNDIDQATQVAREMVVEYGMSDLGPINFGPNYGSFEWGKTWSEQPAISPDMQSKIDNEIKKLIDAGHERAVSILKKMRKELDLVAEELIKKETLDGEEFEKLMGMERPKLESRI